MPKKDLCLFCETYRVLEEKEKKKTENEYNLHVERKEDVRIQKQQDKEKAKTDKTIKVINFDLQKVLISPKTEVGTAYYSRKLSTYNFTVFDVDSTKAICYYVVREHGTKRKQRNSILSLQIFRTTWTC